MTGLTARGMQRHGAGKRIGILFAALLFALGLFVTIEPVQASTTVHNVNAQWIPGEGQTVETVDGVSQMTSSGSRVAKMQLGFSTSGNDPIEPEQLRITVPREVFKMHSDSESKMSFPWEENGDYEVTENDDGSVTIINKIQLEAATQQTIDISWTVSNTSQVWGNQPGEPFTIKVELPGQPPVESNVLKVKVVNKTELSRVTKKMADFYMSWQDGWDESFKPENPDDYYYGTWTIDARLSSKTDQEQAFKMYIQENCPDGEIVGYAPIKHINVYANVPVPSYGTMTAQPENTSNATNSYDQVGDGYAEKDSNGYYNIWGVLVKYPKSMFQDKDEVKLTNKAKLVLQTDSEEPIEEEIEASYTYKNIGWYDGTLGGTGYNAQKAGKEKILGAIDMLRNDQTVNGFDFRVSADATNQETRLVDGKTVAEIGREFTLEIKDDLLYFPLKDKPLRLQAGDYEIAGFDLGFTAKVIKWSISQGQWTAVDADWAKLEAAGRNPVMEVWGYKAGTGWIKLAAGKHNPDEDGVSQYNQYRRSGEMMYTYVNEDYCVADNRAKAKEEQDIYVTIKEGSGISRLKWTVTANKGIKKGVVPGMDDADLDEYIFNINIGKHSDWYYENFLKYPDRDDFGRYYGRQMHVRLFPDNDRVRQAVAEYDAGEKDELMYLDNVITAFYLDEEGRNVGTNDTGTSVAADEYYRDDVFAWDDATYAEGKPEAVKMWGGGGFNTEDGNYLVHRIGRNFLTEIDTGSSLVKEVNSNKNDPDNKRYITEWKTTAQSWVSATGSTLQDLIDNGLYEPLNEGVIYDLLPKGMTVPDSEIKLYPHLEGSTDGNRWSNSGLGQLVRGVDFTVEHTPNWNNSGRELITIRYKYDWMPTTEIDNYSVKATSITAYLKGYYSWESIFDYGNTYTNLAAFETGHNAIPDGEYAIPTYDKYTEEETTWMSGLDPSYTEITGETPGKFLYTKSKSVTINTLTQARYGLSKTIKGPESPAWGTGRKDETDNQIVIPTGGLYQYRLRYAPTEGTKLTDMILYDALEKYDPDMDTVEKLAERQNTTGTPSDTEDQGTVRWKGTLLSIDVSQPANIIGKEPKVYVTTDRNFQVDEKNVNASDGNVLTYHDNPVLDVENRDVWQEISVDSKTNIATIPDNLKGKVKGIAIDMRKGKLGMNYTLENMQSVAVILNMQGPTDPLEVRDLVVRAQNLKNEDTAKRPYTYNGVSMNAVLKTSSDTPDAGSVITNYYTRLTLRIPEGQIYVTKKTEGQVPSDQEFTFRAYGVGYDLEDATDEHGESYQKLVRKENGKLNYTGKYIIVDTKTGSYVDKEGNLVSSDDPEDKWLHTTDDGTFTIKAGQRAQLMEAVGDIPYVVEEIDIPDDIIGITNVVNGKTADGAKTGEFVVGDQMISNVDFTNRAGAKIKLEKELKSGDASQAFPFTVTITDGEGSAYLNDDETPATFRYTKSWTSGEGTLKSGDTISLKGGQSIEIGVPADAKYTITEAVPEGYNDPEIAVSGGAEGDPVKTKESASHQAAYGSKSQVKFTNSVKPDENPEKKILDGENYLDKLTLEQRDEEITYVIDAPIPADASKIEITDTIKDVLEFVGSEEDVKVTCDSQEIADAKVTIDGQTLTVLIQDKKADADSGQEGTTSATDVRNKVVEVTFKARIKEGADLAPYAKSGSVNVPNEAEVTFNDDRSLKTEPVTVTPPDEDEEIEKEVNGGTHADLETPVDTFHYDVTAYVPANASKIVITDTLKDVLEFVSAEDDVEVTCGDEAVEGAKVKIDGQKLTVTIADGEGEDEAFATAQRTHRVKVSFEAKIREGADLSPYAKTGTVLVPNTAEYAIDDEPATESEPVTVTPPEDEEKIDKDVNGESAVKLETPTEAFTYTLTSYVPADAVKIQVTDTLEEVLEVVDPKEGIKVTLSDGTEVEGAKTSVDGQTVKVIVENGEGEDEAFATNIRTRYLVVTFDAKIRKGADLSPYADLTVPNKASYIINDNPDRDHESDTVTVTPPDDEPKIEKSVTTNETRKNNQLGGAAADEIFTYTIDTRVPLGMKTMSVIDDMDKALKYVEKSSQVLVGGKKVNIDPVIKGNRLIWVLDDLRKGSSGEDVQIIFKARFKDSMNLTPTQIENGVPNDVALDLNGERYASNTVRVVNTTITQKSKNPPTNPGLTKSVETSLAKKNMNHGDLGSRDEVFTYTLDTAIPEGTKEFTVYDVLEPVLSYVDDSAVVEIGGKAATDVPVQVSGNKLTFDLSAYCKSAGGEEVAIIFDAQIKNGANLEKYRTDGKIRIPNRAGYTIDGTYYTSNKVTVTPPSGSGDGDGSKTGDSSMIGLFLAMLLTAMAGVAVIARRRRITG